MMHYLARFALACGVVLSLSATAYAADAIDEVPEASVPLETAPLYTWDGPYLGAFLGYEWAEYDDFGSENGISGGIYGGYNWQSGSWVYGVEADIGFGDVNSGGGAVSIDQDVFGSLRGRLGYDLNSFLLYGTGGLALSNTDVSDETDSDSDTLTGWTVGAGVEKFFTPSVAGRIEYRYSDYDGNNVNLPSGSFSSGFDEHSVRAGIGIKF